MLLGGTGQCLHVLREARAAVACARVDEVPADARVRADALADLLDVGTDAFGNVGDFVHE